WNSVKSCWDLMSLAAANAICFSSSVFMSVYPTC
ncbi:MAG: hypothetical protein ACI8XZ_005308, partial [Gammaproteobacteria bacterium]